MTLYHQGRTIKVEFSTLEEVQKQPNLSRDENFYILYSPETVKIKPCTTIKIKAATIKNENKLTSGD